jgi:hypothetical protein
MFSNENCFRNQKSNTQQKLFETQNRHGFREFVLTFPLYDCRLPFQAFCVQKKNSKNNVSHFESNYLLIFLDKRQSERALGRQSDNNELGNMNFFS